MNTKPTNSLLQLFISIAITVGVVLVFSKPLPDNDQAGGYLIQQQQQQQQQQPLNAGEEFVVAYGGDIPNNYNLDSPELNTDPSFEELSNPTPTIQENPTPAEGELVAFDGWLDNLINGIFGGKQQQQPVVTMEMRPRRVIQQPVQKSDCGEAKKKRLLFRE